MQPDYVFSSESVTDGHPDKLCDRIADALVDAYLRQDPLARVVATAAASSGIIFVSVKFASTATVDVPNVSRDVIRDAGYRGPGFDARNCTVMTSLIDARRDTERLNEERLEDAELDRVVAADQATLFGYACRHTDTLMPLPVDLAHRLAMRLAEVRRRDVLPFLEPDGKTQVGVEFRSGRPHRIHTITVITSQRAAGEPGPEALEEAVRAEVIGPALAPAALQPDARTRIAVNPEGPMVPGGPLQHAGVTGRKGGVDTYGEFARQSGSALSGKDPSRVDRVGAYAARHAAKNVVAAGLAEACEVQLSYAVGLARPVSVHVETFGTGRVDEGDLTRRLTEVFDFRPAAIVRTFRLRTQPLHTSPGFYQKLAAYGQMGRRDLELPWERTDRVEALR